MKLIEPVYQAGRGCDMAQNGVAGKSANASIGEKLRVIHRARPTLVASGEIVNIHGNSLTG